MIKIIQERCVSCNGCGFRYIRYETGYVSNATVTCFTCAGTGFASIKEIINVSRT